jgi:hypothetical protein
MSVGQAGYVRNQPMVFADYGTTEPLQIMLCNAAGQHPSPGEPVGSPAVMGSPVGSPAVMGSPGHFTWQNGQGLDRSIIHKNQGLIKYLPLPPCWHEKDDWVWKRTELAESSCPAGSGQWLVEDGQRGKEGGGPEWWAGLQDALR